MSETTRIRTDGNRPDAAFRVIAVRPRGNGGVIHFGSSGPRVVIRGGQQFVQPETEEVGTEGPKAVVRGSETLSGPETLLGDLRRGPTAEEKGK
jgi:hypothetical protein